MTQILKLKDIKIEILKKIDVINNYKNKIKTATEDEIDDIIDFIKNDIEKMQDFCLYLYCAKSDNNNNNNNNNVCDNKESGFDFYYILQYISYPILGDSSAQECKCKYHFELNDILNEMIFLINQIRINREYHYLFYHTLDKFKHKLF
jgi:hypothetical protein